MNAHTCEPYEILISCAVDERLPHDEQCELLDHLVRCEACRRFYGQARELDGVLAMVRPATGAPSRPAAEVWDRIQDRAEPAAALPDHARSYRGWGWQAAAAILLAVGLGAVLWFGASSPISQPLDTEIELAGDRNTMDEIRFIQLTREVLRADRRYHVALFQVMDQVLRDTGSDEQSGEGLLPRSEDDDGEEIQLVASRVPA